LIEPDLCAVGELDFLDVPLGVLFEEPEVHSVEHLAPVVRLCAAVAGVDGEVAVARVVPAREE